MILVMASALDDDDLKIIDLEDKSVFLVDSYAGESREIAFTCVVES